MLRKITELRSVCAQPGGKAMSTVQTAPRSTPSQGNPRRPKRGSYKPKAETLALLKVSGNPINGLGETTPRRPSPFFWHPSDQHPYGELQIVARNSSRSCPGVCVRPNTWLTWLGPEV